MKPSFEFKEISAYSTFRRALFFELIPSSLHTVTNPASYFMEKMEIFWQDNFIKTSSVLQTIIAYLTFLVLVEVFFPLLSKANPFFPIFSGILPT